MKLRATAALAAASAALLVLTLAGCTPERTQVTASGTPSVAPTLANELYEQEIEWRQCAELECGTLLVPLDWANPAGETAEVAVNRLKATGEPIGSLLINPGGPGGSGLELAEYFGGMAGEDLLEAYDVVGFDPRGVGGSTSMDCGSAATVDAFVVTDYPLQTENDVAAARQRNVDFAEECRDHSGAIAENMDTVSAARDMDLLRAVLGDEKLNYLGFSYGTQLGATYAQLYPANVGRLVLDGAVDFLLPADDQAAGQATGFERALGNYIEWCYGEDDCPLETNVDAARKQIHDLAYGAIANPVPGTNGDVNGNLMVYGIVVTLYDEASWPYLTLALQEVIEHDTAAIMGELADFYLDRDASGEYVSNSTVAFYGVSCLDAVPGAPWDLARVDQFRAQMEAASPTFGWWFASSVGCDGWPLQPNERVESLDATVDAAPILVVGTTNDPATPYAWAQSLTAQLGHATLLTYEGEGHTAYGRSNQCIIDAVDGFLVDGVMPPAGTIC